MILSLSVLAKPRRILLQLHGKVYIGRVALLSTLIASIQRHYIVKIE